MTSAEDGKPKHAAPLPRVVGDGQIAVERIYGKTKPEPVNRVSVRRWCSRGGPDQLIQCAERRIGASTEGSERTAGALLVAASDRCPG